MKKTSLFIIINFLAFSFLLAQGGPDRCRINNEQIQARRVAFISQQTNFTPSEAQQFWPLYNTYQKERNTLQDQVMFKMHGAHKGMPKNFDITAISEKEAQELVGKRVQIADLEKGFHTDIQKILPAKKILLFYHAEMDFQRELLRELRKEHKKKEQSRPE